MPLASSTISLPEVSGNSFSTSVSWRPTIMAMSESIGVSAIGTVAMYWPSRITVTRSAMRLSSSILCEM